MNTETIAELKEKARAVRLGIIDALGIDKRGHLGGSLSCADIVTALYFHKMRHDPQNRFMADRDRFVMSKGHSVLAQYAALAEAEYFPKETLHKTKTLGCFLQGHPERETPGVEANTGSLGQGLSIGVGMALGGRLDGLDYHTWVILGDGELAEGQVWEAATAAAAFKLDTLTAIVDMNGIQAVGRTRDRYDLGDIRGKFAAFGWKTFEIDGHNMEEIVKALDEATAVRCVPTVIVARTVKGRGVSFAENTHAYHNNLLTKEQQEQARRDIRAM